MGYSNANRLTHKQKDTRCAAIQKINRKLLSIVESFFLSSTLFLEPSGLPDVLFGTLAKMWRIYCVNTDRLTVVI